jgi:phage/plasmid-associated DNA primase
MNADRMMPAKLETELSGIFNWMVEGMKRMNEKGTLTYNKLPDETRQLYKKLSSPFSSFCSECIREEMDGHVTRDELYEKYCAYCRDNNLSPESSQMVYKQMMIDSVARTEKRTINGARVNVYCNIKIVIPDEKEEDERPPESSPLDRYGSDGK